MYKCKGRIDRENAGQPWTYRALYVRAAKKLSISFFPRSCTIFIFDQKISASSYDKEIYGISQNSQDYATTEYDRT